MNSLFHECTERSNACAGSDHDDIRLFVVGENEGFRRRHKHPDGSAGCIDFISHELRAETTTRPAVVFEAYNTNGQLNKTWVGVVRRSDGIEPRFQAVGELQELFRRVLDLKLTHDVNIITSPKVVLDRLRIGVDGFNLR